MEAEGMGTHISDLPDEVLHLVFSMLPVEQLATCVQHVCKHWLTISHDWRFWENFSFRVNINMPDNEIVEFLKQAPMLRSFETEKLVDVSTLCNYCPNVRHIKISCDSINGLPFTFNNCSIPTIFKTLTGLESFTLNTREHDYLSKNALECIALSSTLKSLEILGPAIFAEMDGIMTLWKLLVDGVPALEKIIIDWCEITIEDLTYLVERKRDKLTAIGFTISDFTDDCLNQIMQCEKLETLHISTNESDVCLNRLGELPLKELSLQWQGQDFLQLLLSKSWNHLKKLDLGYSDSNDTTVNIIVNQCPILNSLQLDATLITERGLKNLHKMPRLQHISVKDCNLVTDETVRDIALCRNLLSVNLVRCYNLTDGALNHLLTCNTLREMRMDECIKLVGRPFRRIPDCLPDLKLLSLVYCDGLFIRCVEKLKAMMPTVTIVAEVAEDEGFPDLFKAVTLLSLNLAMNH